MTRDLVRLYEDWEKQQRSEVYGLRSGGWRPVAGPVPSHAARGLDAGRSPVFLNGFFYWHIDIDSNIRFSGQKEADSFISTPEPILSLSIDTEQIGWVRPPEQRTQRGFRLTELWTGSGSPATSWSLRCRISLASLPAPMREELGRGIFMLPLASSFGGKILLASSCHDVHAYDPEKNSADVVFSMGYFMKAPPGDAVSLVNIALHEESVTSGWNRTVSGDDAGQLLKMKIGSTQRGCQTRRPAREGRSWSSL
ncbi:hypothetical protein PR202_gb06582 [Eleusine coracana subsp. coracana]|uniref:Uncharacterized protein n=1 Tax=Eleusine coracana subsp. coracana TaxID=191504 RepID=A0AAV5E7H3_ELECO|nr:hypothetical protein PR202_gb06582 [Eleusine coracana subsp. coracana]